MGNIKTDIMKYNAFEKKWLEKIDDFIPEQMRVGNDFMMMDHKVQLEVTDAFRLDDFVIAVICWQGEAIFSIDMEEYRMAAPFMAVVMSGKIVWQKYISEDYRATVIVSSDKFNYDLLGSNSINLRLGISVNKTPAIRLTERDGGVLEEYVRLMKNAIANTSNPMRLEVVRHLTLAMYYGYGNRFLITAEKKSSDRTDELMAKFISLVEEWHKKERRLVFYADKMCLTVKYLSQVVRRASGKTAADWIDYAVVLEAKTLLNCTEMSIQQITDELNFPDQSTFGKYFKHHTGFSPREFRNSIG